jgi:anthranilate phosphoribosyltransferase
VIGVFEPSLLEIFSQVCQQYIKEALIVYAHDGFDELSNTCENDILWITSDGKTKRIRLHPKAVGMQVAKPEQMVMNSKEESIRTTLEAIYGKATKEKEDIVVLNTAAALVISKIAPDFKDGIEMARNTIKNGKAQDKLMQLIRYCGNIEKLKEAEKRFL